jgi:hypothetical protein
MLWSAISKRRHRHSNAPTTISTSIRTWVRRLGFSVGLGTVPSVG